MIGLGVGIDYSLFIVTRFRQLLHDGLSPRDAAAEAGASAGRAVHLRRPHGRDLGQRPRLHRPRLRDEARDRQRPRRADDGADRELAADRGSRAARPQGRPAQGAVPAPRRRLRGGAREDARRALGPVRDRERQDRVPGAAASPVSILAGTSALVRLGAADQGTQPLEQTSRRAYDLLAEGFGRRLQRPDPDRRRRQRRQAGAAEDLRRRAGPQGRGVRRQAAVQRREDRRDRLRHPDSAPQDEATDKLVDRLRDDVVPAATAGGDARRLRLGPDGGLQGHRRPDHRPDADLPALHHRRHVPRAGDGVPLDRRLGDGGDHDDPLRVRRLRRARRWSCRRATSSA